MVIEYIAVGTELILGDISNTNGAFLGEEFSKLGLTCYYHTNVGDNRGRIVETLALAAQRSDIILLSGGIGPTSDDVTIEAVSEFTGIEFTTDEFGTDILKGAIILDNEIGHSSGQIVETEDVKIILLPGQPAELRPIFMKHVVGYLKKNSDSTIITRTVKLSGISETELEDKIAILLGNYSNPSIAICTKIGEIHVHVTAKAKDEKECERLIKPVIKELKTLVGEYIFTTEDDVTLEQAVVDLLKANKLMVTTIESCTGGMVCARLINVPGVSEVVRTGYITYSDKAKHRHLGVKRSTLSKYTAVSKQVCEEMAQAPALLSKADVICSVTGIAGPDGGTEKTPVGTVFIGCNVKGKIKVNEYHFKGDRQAVREAATTEALNLMRLSILKYISETTFGMKEK